MEKRVEIDVFKYFSIPTVLNDKSNCPRCISLNQKYTVVQILEVEK